MGRARSLVAVLVTFTACSCAALVSSENAGGLAVEPSSTQLPPSASILFTATASADAANTSVTWSVVESGGGQIDASGLYTAPAQGGDFHVRAISAADPTASATALVHVVAPSGNVVVSPASAYLRTGQSLTFTATFASNPSATIDWTVSEGSAGGSISSGGTYTAPSSAGTYHVVATPRGDSAHQSSATVVVSNAPAAVTPLPVISRGVPAYSSGSYYGNAAANDADYTTTWFANSSPSWLALDLSSVPAAQRTRVVVAWYNAATPSYDATVLGGATYGLPGTYTIGAHAAAGGGAPPSSSDGGWVTLATVTGNTLSSRQHVVDLTGYNWVRMSISSDCSFNVGTTTTSLNLDVHDAHAGLIDDDWLFVGDSITAAAWKPGSFAKLVQAGNASYFPVAENAGIGYQTTASVAPLLPGWLARFPGRFVAISLGTNDANGNLLPAAALNAIYANYETMVKAVLAAGKIPVIPTVISSPTAQLAANLPAVNAKLAALKAAYPAIVAGPDLYAAFLGHPEWFADGLHPNDTGYAQLRQEWARAMLATVYP